MNEALREKTVFMRFFSPMYHHTRRTRRPKGVYKVIECTIEQGIVCSATCSKYRTKATAAAGSFSLSSWM